MSFFELVHQMLRDTLETSLWTFRPELAIVATIVLILLARLLMPEWKWSAYYVMLVGTAVALYFAAPWHYLAGGIFSERARETFTGMLVFDGFAVYMRSLILLFVLLFAVLTRLARTVDADEAIEFYVLVLGATLGMCLMVSANHMLIVFLGVEMASVPSYVLAGFLKHRRQSAEAALKYAVFGAATAGVMLYGISLLTGALGSAHLPTMAAQLAAMLRDLQGGTTPDCTMALVLGGLMVMVGLAFKLSAVPFHFWAPDVFEGAAAEVAAFLSVASKAAALGLLVRLALGFGYLEPQPGLATARSDHVQAVVRSDRIHAVPGELALYRPDESGRYERSVADGGPAPRPETTLDKVKRLQGSVERLRALERQDAIRPQPSSAPARDSQLLLADALAPVREYVAALVALLAAVTCTFGNLAAYGQTNMKRLLAYSTIAHAGYMMMPVAAAVALAGSDTAGAQAALAALAFYVGVYLFMNLGVFAGVAFLRGVLASEEIADYAGLVRRSPGLAVCLCVLLFSLVGLPPLAGFAAKFTVFAALLDAGLLGLLIIGAANTVLSLFYYLRVVKVMVLESEGSSEERPAAAIPLFSPGGVFCLAVTAPVLVLGIWWGGLFQWAEAAASSLLR